MTARTVVRQTTPADFVRIGEFCQRVYPDVKPWTPALLAAHLEVFPEGQFVAEDVTRGVVVGMAASLRIRWDDYNVHQSWREFTENGTFANHDPEGRTLYGAEVMVDPTLQRSGVGSKLYAARRELVERLGLLRIRAGARLRGYGKVAHRMSAEDYVVRVIRGEMKGPTLSFQLKHGFRVIAVVSDYLKQDPESLGYAAVIEWINEQVVDPEALAARDKRFTVPPPSVRAHDAQPPSRGRSRSVR